jgi:flagellar basal-body rod protein FlgC
MDIYDITASALTAQRLRLDAISSNLANVNTTRRADGTPGAYRRKQVVFAPVYENATRRFPGIGKDDLAGTLPMRPTPAGVSIGADGRPMLQIGISHNTFEGAGVQVTEVAEDSSTPMRMEYNPTHPDANKDGYVEMPNVNVVKEMIDMISANRAYEANVTAFQSAKGMNKAAMQI